MIRVDVVYALIYQESTQKILMVHNKGSGWSLPGGRVEKEETLEQAVIREVKEETNLTVEIDGIIAVNESFFKSQHHHTIFFTFKVKNIKGNISIVHEEEISEIKWMDITEANRLMPYYPNGVAHLLKYSTPYVFQKK